MTAAVRWLVLGIAAAMWLQAAPLAAGDETAKAEPDDPAVVARGKLVYDQRCASCHGAHLEGQPNWRHSLPNGKWPAPPHDATGHTWHHSDKVLFDVTKYGMRAMVPDRDTDMPGFEDKLSDADIWAVLSYIKNTWPADIRARQERMSQPKP